MNDDDEQQKIDQEFWAVADFIEDARFPMTALYIALLSASALCWAIIFYLVWVVLS